MTSEPYASARRVFWIVNNGASHRNWAAAAHMHDAFPNVLMVHLPVHASWLNYNTTAQPFDWTFTNQDLNRLLTRIGRHDRHTPQPLTA